MAAGFSSRALLLVYVIFLLVVAFEVTWLHSPLGAAMSMDSLSYLSAAQQINLGHGISLPDYTLGSKGFLPMALWPPLYPLLLSIVVPDSHVFGVHSGIYVMWINIVSLWFLLLIFFTVARQFVDRRFALLVAPLLCLMPSMQVIYLYAWSETVFIPVILAAFYCFSLFLMSDQNRHRYLLVCVLLLVVGFYLRYAALGFLGGLIVSLLFVRNLFLWQKIKYVSVSLGLSALLIAPLLVRNYLVIGAPIGYRDASNANLLFDMNTLGTILGGEFFSAVTWLWLLAVVSLVVLIVLVGLDRKLLKSNDEKSISLIFHAGVWALVYLLFLIINRLLSHMDLDSRMIGPIVPFVLLILLGLFQSSFVAIKHLTPAKPIWLVLPALALVLPLMAKNMGVHRDIVNSWQSIGAPGQVLGVFYNSTTNHELAAFQRLSDLVHLDKNAVVLTDLARPQVIHYFFPQAKVSQLQGGMSSEKLLTLLSSIKESGLVVITKNESLKSLSGFIADDEFLQIQDAKGDVYNTFMLLQLPLRDRHQ